MPSAIIRIGTSLRLGVLGADGHVGRRVPGVRDADNAGKLVLGMNPGPARRRGRDAEALLRTAPFGECRETCAGAESEVTILPCHAPSSRRTPRAQRNAPTCPPSPTRGTTPPPPRR